MDNMSKQMVALVPPSDHTWGYLDADPGEPVSERDTPMLVSLKLRNHIRDEVQDRVWEAVTDRVAWLTWARTGTHLWAMNRV